MDVIVMKEFQHQNIDTGNISADELEKLRSLLPSHLRGQQANLSQLDVILQAIHYIKTLKLQLH